VTAKQKPTLVVMAAGVGSRYGGLKQLDPVGPGGEGIIDYSVFDAVRAGFDRVVFIIRRDIEEDFRSIIGRKHERRVDVAYAFQELADLPQGFTLPAGRQKPWGTGQAIIAACSHVRAPFAVINGDDFYGGDAYRTLGGYLETLDPAGTNYAMVGYRMRNTLSEFGTVSRGVCVADDRGNLREVVERLKIEKRGEGAVAHEEGGVDLQFTGDEIVSMNMFGFTPTAFDILERRFVEFLGKHGGEPKTEFLLPREVGTMIASGIATMRMLSSSATWFGITYREDREHVVAAIRALVAKGEYPARIS
jgi:UTP-glucose-1-phosphate uridylyltransferase